MEFIKTIHSYWAYITILMVSIALAQVIRLFFSQTSLAPSDRKVPLFALIATHLQFLLGLILYFTSPVVQQGLKDMSSAMKDAEVRLYIIEHPMMMILAIAFLTIGFQQIKKKSLTGGKLNWKLPIFYLLAFIFILSRIPWNTWLS